MSVVRFLTLAVFAAVLLHAAPVAAQSAEHAVYMDLDANPATGCSVITASGVVTGAEARLTANVSAQPPIVSGVIREFCAGGTFGLPEVQAASYPVGINVGVGGSDVIEMSTSLVGLGDATAIGLTFVSTTSSGSDLASGAMIALPAGVPAIASPTSIPSTGLLVLILLAGVLLWFARKHPAFRSTAAVVLMLGAGVVWAANFITDGQVGDWMGVAPLATDVSNDSTSSEASIDIVATFAAVEAGRLFVRVDVRDAEVAPPSAMDDSVTIAENSGASTIDVLGNDSNPGGGTISVVSVTQPGNGAVVITGGGSALTYAPATDYCNTPPGTTLDTFTYTLAPGSSTATVSVTVTCVDEAPVAVDDAASVAEDAGASTINVLANDTDADGGPISITSVTQPANGTVVIAGGGSALTYAPASDYCNTPPGTALDTFTYTLAPGSNTATVSVTVNCSDDAPVAVDDAASVNEDGPASTIDVLANDTDVDAGPISITSVTQPANGTVVITGGGTGLTYQPVADYCNTPPGTALDAFTYVLTPGNSTATVSMTVNCIDDPPTAVDDPVSVGEDSGATAIDVFTNDIDIDGGAISVASVTQPANGTVVVTGGGTGLTYQPDPDFCNTPPGTATDDFTYSLAPGGSTATVNMTVTCIDDAPVAVDDAISVDQDSGATPVDVLANDTDVDGGATASVASVTQPANGTVVITGAGSGLTYEPDAGYCNAPPGAALDEFSYTLAPGGSTATVSVTVDQMPIELLNRPRGAINSGFRNTIYSDPGTAGSNAQFAADDFVLTQATSMATIAIEGFVVSGQPLGTSAATLTWSIFADAAGVPAGDPLRSPGTATWTYEAAPGSAGVSIVGDVVTLDLAAAGETVNLAAGTYWLVMNTTSSFANRWAHFASAAGDGSFRSLTVDTGNGGTWATNTGFSGLNMLITATADCP